MVTKLEDASYLTVCKVCKRTDWRYRTQVEQSESDHPAVKFGTKPEANNYLRLHESTAYHLRNVSRRFDQTPSNEEILLRAIFHEKPIEDGCPYCGKNHARWAECGGPPRLR